MLDPLTALSVVGSVISIIDFGCKLLSQSQEIYQSRSGATKDNVTHAEITSDIRMLYKDLKENNQRFQRSNADDIALGALIDKCDQEAINLLELLDTLKVDPNATQWTSFRKAIRSARKKGKVEDIEKRLLNIQKQIDSRLHKMMSYVSLAYLNQTNLYFLAINNLHCPYD